MMNHNKNQGGFVFMMVVVTLFLLAAIALTLSRQASVANNLGNSLSEQERALFAAEAGLKHAAWRANASNCGTYTNIPATPLYGENGQTYTASYFASSGSPVDVTATGTTGSGATATKRQYLRVYQLGSTNVLTLAGDTYIDSFASSTNNVTDKKLKLSSITGNLRHGLFMLPAMPYSANTRISKASLRVYSYGGATGGALNVELFALTKDWNPAAATWMNADSGAPWTTPGGDYQPIALANKVISPTTPGINEFDITAHVQEAVKSGSSAGLLMRIAKANVEMDFGSSKANNAAERPQLEITTSCECGRQCTQESGCSPDYIPSDIKQTVDAKAATFERPGGVSFAPAGQVVNGVTLPDGGGILYLSDHAQALAVFGVSGALLTHIPLPYMSAGNGLTWIQSGANASRFLVADENEQELHLYDSNGNRLSVISTRTRFEVVAGLSHIDKAATTAYNNSLLVAGIDRWKRPAVMLYSGDNLRLLRTMSIPNVIRNPKGIQHIPDTDHYLVLDKDSSAVFRLDFSGQLIDSYDTLAFGSKDGAGLGINTDTCDHLYVDRSTDELLMLYPGDPCTSQYTDDHESNSYHGSNGAMDWSPEGWEEITDDNDSATGDIRLHHTDSGIWLGISGPSNIVKRNSKNLPDSDTIGLTFDLRKLSLDDAADFVTLQINSGGTGWIDLAQFSGPASDETSSESFDISDYRDKLIEIRFSSSAGMGTDDSVLIDNISVQTCN